MFLQEQARLGGPTDKCRSVGLQEEVPESLESLQAERVCWSWPRGTDCKAPERQAEGQAGNTEGCSSSRRQSCQVGEAALTGEWQVPAGRVLKATESGATACVFGHVGAGASPWRPTAASLPEMPVLALLPDLSALGPPRKAEPL